MLPLAAAWLLAGVTLLAACGAQDERPTTTSDRRVGSEAVATWIEELRIPDPALWKRRVAALGGAGAPAVPALIEALRDPSRAVREGAAHALGDIGARAAPAVEALIVAFEDPDDFVRWKAARALGRIGPAARAAVPILRPAATDPRETEVVRATAIRALEQISGSGS